MATNTNDNPLNPPLSGGRLVGGKVELWMGGSVWEGWKSLECQRGIEQLAGTFRLGLSERFPGAASAQAFRPGLAVQLLLDGDPVITGFADEVSVGYEAQGHSISLDGRDKTGDLVDCAAVFQTGQWRGAKLERIARDLCAPFGVLVVPACDTGAALPSHDIQPGESVFECLERAARMRAVLLTSDTMGRLVLSRAGSVDSAAVLEEGVNILKASGSFSWKDRFSKITVKGQGLPSDDFPIESAAGPSATCRDDVIDRYRPLIVLAEEHGEAVSMRDRAEWERNVRAGRGNRATITVQGWRSPSGALWEPNTMVHVRSPMLYVDAPLLIVGCTFRLGEDGTTTELSVCRREAFVLIEGVGASKLNRKLNDKAQSVKKQKGDDWGAI